MLALPSTELGSAKNFVAHDLLAVLVFAVLPPCSPNYNPPLQLLGKKIFVIPVRLILLSLFLVVYILNNGFALYLSFDLFLQKRILLCVMSVKRGLFLKSTYFAYILCV